MDSAMTDARMPYDDPQSPAQLREACRAASDALALPGDRSSDLDSVAKAAARPAPSIRFEHQRLSKGDLDMLAAAEMLAAALCLELD